jgi:DNA-binding transcriptional MerR regulator
MSDLRRIREGWAALERERIRLLRQMTVQEGIRQYLALQRALEPHFQQTEALFRPQRMAYLAELQERLSRLERWRKERRGESA